MNIGEAIKKIRQEKNISQGDLAKACKITQPSLSYIENGTKKPSAKNLEKICKILGVPEAVIYLRALNESDVPAKKKELFRMLYPAVEGMIKQMY